MNDKPLPSLEDPQKGTIAWMVHNRVTPNILMLVLLIGGLFMLTRVKQEVFPEFELDRVTVRVPYPGASPEEVEQGIVLVVEERVRGIEGVKEVTSSAAESIGTVNAELFEGVDRQKVYQDIQQEVARINTFPDDAEEPVVTLTTRRRDVLEVQIYGNVSELALRDTAEQMRDRLLQSPSISQIDLEGAREYEIHVEVPQESLRRYGLTVSDIARKLGDTALEVPGGKIETRAGEVLIRMTERRDWAREFAQIPIVSTADGTTLRLEAIATVSEGFEDSDEMATFNGMPAIGLEVFRIGDETPISVSTATRERMLEIEADLPAGIDWVILNDRSEIYNQRLTLLLKNGAMGLILVLAVLGLFLEFKLAFWVMMGIPISFLGGLLVLPFLGVSINMISMFAFIIALGIVVDDAIVAGENVYEYRQRGMSLIDSAIRGARDVAMPVTFSIITNVIAFIPLYFVPGTMGKIWKVIPLVVCTVFIISLFEAVFILPAHLAHTSSKASTRVGEVIHHLQQRFSDKFGKFIHNWYGPFISACVRQRALTVAISFAILILTFGYIGSGRIGFIPMPKVESDVAVVTATLPFGSPMEQSLRVQQALLDGGQLAVDEHGGEELSRGIFSSINNNEVQARIYLTPPEQRPISTRQLTELWRDQVGPISGVESLRYESDRGGPGGGPSLTVELSHINIDTLDRASESLAARLEEFSVTKDVDDGYTPGKIQLNFRIKPEGESLGLTARNLATQVRAAFQGVEAIKQQRGRNEVTVRVRRPEAERINEFDIERMIVQTPAGGEVPLMDVADVTRGRAYTSISRRDGRRTVTVTAGVEPLGETTRVQATLDAEILPQLARDFPGLTYGYEGRQAEMRDSMNALMQGLILALLCIYVTLAIPFRSYVQPAIVMLAIPFGIVGATLGHMLMGYNLSIISVMGIVALAGVVVNDSLVLINFTNQLVRDEGLPVAEAVQQAGIRRFRPILLTTLTTFGGLAPMIFETSRQARFMIPMAISLGFGILFATGITLIVLPCMYVMLEDLRRGSTYVLDFLAGRPVKADAKPAAMAQQPDAAPLHK